MSGVALPRTGLVSSQLQLVKELVARPDMAAEGRQEQHFTKLPGTEVNLRVWRVQSSQKVPGILPVVVVLEASHGQCPSCGKRLVIMFDKTTGVMI